MKLGIPAIPPTILISNPQEPYLRRLACCTNQFSSLISAKQSKSLVFRVTRICALPNHPGQALSARNVCWYRAGISLPLCEITPRVFISQRVEIGIRKGTFCQNTGCQKFLQCLPVILFVSPQPGKIGFRHHRNWLAASRQSDRPIFFSGMHDARETVAGFGD